MQAATAATTNSTFVTTGGGPSSSHAYSHHAYPSARRHEADQSSAADVSYAAARKETAATLVENLAKFAAVSSALPPRIHPGSSNHHHQGSFFAQVATSHEVSTATTASSSNSSASPTPQTVREETLFQTIGMGIVPNFVRENISVSQSPEESSASSYAAAGDDATDAACKALQDALERGMLSFAPFSSQQQKQRLIGPRRPPPPQLSVRLGVPTKISNPHELMHVDQYRILKQLAPLTKRVELQHIDLVVGGLWAEQSQSQPPQRPDDSLRHRHGILTVVACLSVVQPHWPAPTPNAPTLLQTATVTSATPPLTTAGPLLAQVCVSSSSKSNQQATVVPPPQDGSMPATPRSQVGADATLKQPQNQSSSSSRLNHNSASAAAAALQEEEQDEEDEEDEEMEEVTTTAAAASANPNLAQHALAQQQMQQGATAAVAVAAIQAAAGLEVPTSLASKHVHRASSMDVLAHVSAEIRDSQKSSLANDQYYSSQEYEKQQEQEQHQQAAAAAVSRIPSQVGEAAFYQQQHSKPSNSPQPMRVDSPPSQRATQAMRGGSDESSSLQSPTTIVAMDEHSMTSYGDKYGNNTNYKKLPPGKTPKNNNRLFVKHSYQDFSDESPTEEEKNVLTTGSTNSTEKTPNAAFPLKLHETLSEIERDGHDDIIGWLGHGRSFKIHKQQEFVQLILPKYFVMTKKSSFLRQLNLYGFNRLSGVGPDQASYYHEKFLRGMKFLCRRMQRCKVNGNRIRAAGNPDGEPNLSMYPTCPTNGGHVRRNSSNKTSVGPNHESLSPRENNLSVAVANNSNNSVHHLATAAVLQYMAQQQEQQRQAQVPVAAAASGIEALSSILALVPEAAAGSSSRSFLEPGTGPSLLTSLPSSQLQQQQGKNKQSPSQPMRGVETKANRSLSVSSESSESTSQAPDAVNNSNNKNPSSSNNNNSSNNGKNLPSQMGTSFPLKLQRILDKLESDRNNSIISWLPHGRAFMVHDSERFVQELMPLYFNQTKFSSFQRQLHMYNFQRITSGRDKGAYYHSQFQRANPSLCQTIQRNGALGKVVGGTRPPTLTQSSSPLSTTRPADPDFSQMLPLPPVPRGSIVDLPPRVVSFTSSSSPSPSPPSSSSSPQPILTSNTTTTTALSEQQALSSLMALQRQHQQFQQRQQQHGHNHHHHGFVVPAAPVAAVSSSGESNESFGSSHA